MLSDVTVTLRLLTTFAVFIMPFNLPFEGRYKVTYLHPNLACKYRSCSTQENGTRNNKELII